MLLGVNLNFTASGVDVPAQLAELRNFNVAAVRLNILDYSATSPASIANWRNYTQTALGLGFARVIFGFGAGVTGVTAAMWPTYVAALQTQAAWFQAQSDARLELQIGNELELHHDGSITDATLRANLRSLAASCKAIYTIGQVSYASSTTGTALSDWASEGKGALDRMGFNLYDTDRLFANNAAQVVAAFGSSGYVSEWGTNNGFADFYGSEELYVQAVTRRRQVLQNAGISEAYFYSFMELNNKWGIKTYPITGNFRAAWPQVLKIRPWYTGNPNRPIIRAGAPLRPPNTARGPTPNRMF